MNKKLNIIGFLFAAALLVGVAACSTQKATWSNIQYHNITTHYNTWWNGNESLKKGLALMETDTNATAVEDMAFQHAFFNDMIVDMPQHPNLPKVKRHIRLKTNGIATVLLSLQNGDPLLVTETVGKGQAFVMATALDAAWSDMADNALFVPMMVKMAFMGGKMDKMSYTIGMDKMLVLSDLNLESARSS